MRVRRLFLGALLVASTGCHRGEPTPRSDVNRGFRRGDAVVVERAAAEFFEARVLSVTGASLKVQTADDEPALVAASDAYRLPGALHTFAAKDPAICRTERDHWAPCRVVTAGGSMLVVELGSGETEPRSRTEILAPSSVTALDIERFFEVRSARSRFREASLAAGNPRRPSAWTPAPHEPVLARKRLDWYSAHALSPLGDGGVRVVWEGSEYPEGLPGTYVVPAPPFTHTFARGDFALVRPDSPGQPWDRVRIDGLADDDALVTAADGLRRHVPPRSLVPLEAAP